jgi:hypothetical protein
MSIRCDCARKREHPLKNFVWLLIVITAVMALPLEAESVSREFAGKWFLNPQTQNWTCATEPGLLPIGAGQGAGKCGAGFINNLAFVHAIPTVRTRATGTKYFFYVQVWAAAEGPGSECAGSDTILLFESPYSIAGAMGDVAPIYRGTVVPIGDCGGGFSWSFQSVFRDPGFGATYILAQRVDISAGQGFDEIWMGKSLPNAQGYDEGIYFSWQKLLKTTISGHHVYGAYLIPDAGGFVWRGYLSNSHAGGWGATPLIVDWSNNNIRYKTGPGPTEWATIPIGGSMTTTLPYIQHHGFVTDYSFVRGRRELHLTNPVLKSGNRPLAVCNDTPYVNNNNESILSGRWEKGQQPYYLVVDSNFNVVQSDRNLVSSLFPLPSDTGFSHGSLKRVETLAGQSIYYGSQNWSICNVVLNSWNNWSGSGIRFGSVADSVSIFTTQAPGGFIDTLGKSWSVGNELSSSINGNVTHLRYYRAAEETGVHTLKLWTTTGALLGSVNVDFGSDLTAGWEVGALPGNGVAITANSRYVVTVTTRSSRQSKTDCGFASPISNDSLTGYGGRWVEGDGIFPTNSSCANFWTDVYFNQ